MTLKHFIERPVLASVISIVIVIAGIIGLATLPIEQYPTPAPVPKRSRSRSSYRSNRPSTAWRT